MMHSVVKLIQRTVLQSFQATKHGRCLPSQSQECIQGQSMTNHHSQMLRTSLWKENAAKVRIEVIPWHMLHYYNWVRGLVPLLGPCWFTNDSGVLTLTLTLL